MTTIAASPNCRPEMSARKSRDRICPALPSRRSLWQPNMIIRHVYYTYYTQTVVICRFEFCKTASVSGITHGACFRAITFRTCGLDKRQPNLLKIAHNHLSPVKERLCHLKPAPVEASAFGWPGPSRNPDVGRPSHFPICHTNTATYS